MTKNITVTVEIVVSASPEEVWDFTQDYSRRPLWDPMITHADVIEEKPPRKVKVWGQGSFYALFQYKLDKRPERTSVATIEMTSPIIESGGGSWSYQDTPDGTCWRQTNTLCLKSGLWQKLLRPVVHYQLHRSTVKGMQRAKQMIESLNTT